MINVMSVCDKDSQLTRNAFRNGSFMKVQWLYRDESE